MSTSMSTSSCQLIVTADDFGLCEEVNEGVVIAHRDGIVTATSLMVRRPHAADAVRLAAGMPALAVGLHVDLGEWTHHPGRGWHLTDRVVDVDDADGVRDEIDRQLGVFVRLSGTTPSHLDGHQHVQRDGPSATVLRELAARLAVPLRLHDERIRHCGAFHGQDGRGAPYPSGITVEALVAIIDDLPDGATELGCHPGIAVPAHLSVYSDERSLEVATLCDPSVGEALHRRGAVLCRPGDITPCAGAPDSMRQ